MFKPEKELSVMLYIENALISLKKAFNFIMNSKFKFYCWIKDALKNNLP